MKKIFIFILILISMNSFSAYILNNRDLEKFTDKEMLNLIGGNFNVSNELAVTSKARGSNQESATKAENDARLALQGAIKEYSYNILNAYLKETGVSGQGFDSKKMRDFADNIAKEALDISVAKGKWITGRNETVVLYTIEKEKVRKMSAKVFREKLTSLIHKLNEYKNVFENLKIQETNQSY